MEKFVWDIITRFSVPFSIISDNGSQCQDKVKDYCSKNKIRNYYSSLTYPEAMGRQKLRTRRSWKESRKGLLGRRGSG